MMCWVDKDWCSFLNSVGYNEDDVKNYMDNIIDSLEFIAVAGKVIDIESDIYAKRASDVHGEGVFAVRDIKKGNTIGVVMGLKNNKKYRSHLGRFTNHSRFKNAEFKKLDSGEVVAMCTRNIVIGEEILVDYGDHWGIF